MIKIIDTDDKEYLENIKSEDIQIKDFRKLKAYNLAIELYKKVIAICNKLPKTELYVINDQLRRASSSVVAQLAEGNGGLYIKKEINFCSIASGSLCETQAWIDMCLINGYIGVEEKEEVEKIANGIKGLLVVYIRSNLKD